MTEKQFRRRVMEYLDAIEISAKRDVIHHQTERVKDMVADSIYDLCLELAEEIVNGKNAYTDTK